jgi:hypothetical protein
MNTAGMGYLTIETDIVDYAFDESSTLFVDRPVTYERCSLQNNALAYNYRCCAQSNGGKESILWLNYFVVS